MHGLADGNRVRYNQRSRIKTRTGRWKSVIGLKLKSRSFSRQITEVQLGRKVLNTMTALGRPVFEDGPQARQTIGTWIRYYNEERPHSTHADGGIRSPKGSITNLMESTLTPLPGCPKDEVHLSSSHLGLMASRRQWIGRCGNTV